ncbi:hypothetical protein CBQ26_19860 [Deinococcus indicus]|uniref:Uncharacterized protein n=1 Tax=Deinococcus indicus TaxID=223556 RepID=A0A246BF27_9DEIO|nr:hypothetical protein CBQ26_19860 [Deinococcus indicus]
MAVHAVRLPHQTPGPVRSRATDGGTVGRPGAEPDARGPRPVRADPGGQAGQASQGLPRGTAGDHPRGVRTGQPLTRDGQLAPFAPCPRFWREAGGLFFIVGVHGGAVPVWSRKRTAVHGHPEDTLSVFQKQSKPELHARQSAPMPPRLNSLRSPSSRSPHHPPSKLSPSRTGGYYHAVITLQDIRTKNDVCPHNP